MHSFNLIDVSFADLDNGWTVGGEELHTTDGGTTWVNQATGVFGSVSVYAISPTTAWIGGLEDLGRTTDSGATWTIERPSDTDWFCMTFLDADNGWAGGQDQTIDDVPGSIWKRSGSASADIEKDTIARGTGSLLSPASGKLRHPDLELSPMPSDSRLTNKQEKFYSLERNQPREHTLGNRRSRSRGGTVPSMRPAVARNICLGKDN